MNAMLSRVAASLYWMSRYLERADHVARQFDVHLTIVTEPVSYTHLTLPTSDLV